MSAPIFIGMDLADPALERATWALIRPKADGGIVVLDIVSTPPAEAERVFHSEYMCQFFPTPAAEAAGEQHAQTEDARSAVPARRGSTDYLPVGSVESRGARIERESARAEPMTAAAAAREQISR